MGKISIVKSINSIASKWQRALFFRIQIIFLTPLLFFSNSNLSSNLITW